MLDEKQTLPDHIAIIMDGNRRYSKLQGNLDVVKGHEIGVDTLEKVLDWSIELGIEIITTYAFSTENFNRPKHEVEGLMNLFVVNFKRLVDHEKILGKPVGNDEKRGKCTYVTKYGLEQAQKMLDELTKEAINIAKIYNEKGEFLKELALYIQTRNK